MRAGAAHVFATNAAKHDPAPSRKRLGGSAANSQPTEAPERSRYVARRNALCVGAALVRRTLRDDPRLVARVDDAAQIARASEPALATRGVDGVLGERASAGGKAVAIARARERRCSGDDRRRCDDRPPRRRFESTVMDHLGLRMRSRSTIPRPSSPNAFAPQHWIVPSTSDAHVERYVIANDTTLDFTASTSTG